VKRNLPPLNSLKVFESAARLNSFRDAADELCVSPSAVSHQIKALEGYLGQQLFVRKTRATELSPVGNSYFAVVRDSFDRIADETTRIRASEAVTVLTFQIYSPAGVRWFVPKLKFFHNKYPDIRIVVQSSARDVDFERDAVDVGLVHLSSEHLKEDVQYFRVSTPVMMPVCSRGYMESGVVSENPRDLKEEQILYFDGNKMYWQEWLDTFGIQHINMDNCMKLDSHEHCVNFAMKGKGLALAMLQYVLPELEGAVLMEPFPDYRFKPSREWYLAVEKGRLDEDKSLALFVKWVRDYVGSSEEFQLKATE
jgi:LysR family glycine cleavage system transcriptional activator